MRRYEGEFQDDHLCGHGTLYWAQDRGPAPPSHVWSGDESRPAFTLLPWWFGDPDDIGAGQPASGAGDEAGPGPDAGVGGAWECPLFASPLRDGSETQDGRPSDAARPGLMTYSGAWRGSLVHGQGKLRWPAPTTQGYDGGGALRLSAGLGRVASSYNAVRGWGHQRFRYDGNFNAGSVTGQGTFVWASGDRYAGAWLNGQAHGVGVMQFKDGSVYEGQYKCVSPAQCSPDGGVQVSLTRQPHNSARAGAFAAVAWVGFAAHALRHTRTTQ